MRQRTGVKGRMRPRDPSEGHRASTPLELLFDLTFVVAVASIAAMVVRDNDNDNDNRATRVPV